MCQLGTLIAKTVCPGAKQCATGNRAQPNFTPGRGYNHNDMNKVNDERCAGGIMTFMHSCHFMNSHKTSESTHNVKKRGLWSKLTLTLRQEKKW